jgi:hypothetical protein
MAAITVTPTSKRCLHVQLPGQEFRVSDPTRAHFEPHPARRLPAPVLRSPRKEGPFYRTRLSPVKASMKSPSASEAEPHRARMQLIRAGVS